MGVVFEGLVYTTGKNQFWPHLSMLETMASRSYVGTDSYGYSFCIRQPVVLVVHPKIAKNGPDWTFKH
jgi:hypothetical protein